MNDVTVTVSGWVATEPRLTIGQAGSRMVTFRVASTARRFDRTANAWVDGQTEWFTVRVFRAAAVTVGESIAKGQPVIVHGRLRTSTWESEAGQRTDLVIDATSVGHDLTRGIARFTRAVAAVEPADGGQAEADEAPGDGVAVGPEGEELAEALGATEVLADDAELVLAEAGAA